MRFQIGHRQSAGKSESEIQESIFVDWRAADRLKRELLPKANFFLDTNSSTPKLIAGDCLRAGLKTVVSRPFRVVPYFDPGPWGGHWMEEVCNLLTDAPNHAWCFDCVPEGNRLLLGFGDSGAVDNRGASFRDVAEQERRLVDLDSRVK